MSFFGISKQKWGILLGIVLLAGIGSILYPGKGGNSVSHDPLAASDPRTETREAVPETKEPKKSTPENSKQQPPAPPPQASPQERQTSATALTVQVVWKDTGMGVPQADLTCNPMTDAQATSVGKTVTASTQASGQARLVYPIDRYSWLRIEVRATTATTARFQFDTRTPEFAPIANGEKPLRLELQRLYGVFGTVYVSEKGQTPQVPAAGAEVALASQKFGTTTTLADAAGRYEFRHVSDNFLRLAARSGNLVTSGRDIALKGAGLNGPFDLFLKPGVSVTVLVNDKASLLPISGATVEACYGGELRVSVRTNAEGFADLPTLPVGLATLTANAPGYQTEKATMDITGSMQDVTIFSLKQGGKAVIRTVDEKDTPVPDVHLSLNWTSNVEGTPIQTDEKGECRVEGLPLNTGIYVGREKKTQGPDCGFSLFDGHEKEVRVVVTKLAKDSEQADLIGWIGGTVVDENNQPVAGATVLATPYFEGHRPEAIKTLTDASGYFRLENLKCWKIQEGCPPKNQPELAELCYTEPTQPPRFYLPIPVIVSTESYRVTNTRIQIGTEKQIVLTRQSDYKGRVLDKETEQPIPQFDILCVELNQQYRKRIFSETGEFTLNGQVVAIGVSAESYQEEAVELFQSEIKPGTENKDLVVYLKKGAPLQGYVVDEQTRTPLENVLVGCGSQYKDSFTAHYFNEKFIDEGYAEYTNAEGCFEVSATYNQGGLIFYRSDREKLWVSVDNLEPYREANTGRLVFPLKPAEPCGSTEVIWLNRGAPAPPAWKERIHLQKVIGPSNTPDISYLAEIKNPSFSYANGVFRWHNLTTGEYQVRVPPLLADGQLGPESLAFRFTVKSQETTSIRWGAGNTDSLSGRILNAQNLSYSRVYIRLSQPQTSPSTLDTIQDSFSTTDGTYRFESLFPGEYKIQVTATPSGYGASDEKLYQGTVQVNGATQYDIPLAPR
jgi:hypothetical protein